MVLHANFAAHETGTVKTRRAWTAANIARDPSLRALLLIAAQPLVRNAVHLARAATLLRQSAALVCLRLTSHHQQKRLKHAGEAACSCKPQLTQSVARGEGVMIARSS